MFVAYFPRKMCVGYRGKGRGGWWRVWGVRWDWAMTLGMGFLVCVLMDDGYTRNVALLLMIIMYMRSLLNWLGTWKTGLRRGPQGNGRGGKGSLISLSSYLTILLLSILGYQLPFWFYTTLHTWLPLSLPRWVPWCALRDNGWAEIGSRKWRAVLGLNTRNERRRRGATYSRWLVTQVDRH